MARSWSRLADSAPPTTHGHSQRLMAIHSAPPAAMVIHSDSWPFAQRSWELLEAHGRSWEVMGDHGRSWEVMGGHGRSWGEMAHHSPSSFSEIMGGHGRSREIVGGDGAPLAVKLLRDHGRSWEVTGARGGRWRTTRRQASRRWYRGTRRGPRASRSCTCPGRSCPT